MLKLFRLTAGILLILGFQGCPLHAPEFKSNKCEANEDCGKGFACRESRCEDIYNPRRKIRQF